MKWPQRWVGSILTVNDASEWERWPVFEVEVEVEGDGERVVTGDDCIVEVLA